MATKLFFSDTAARKFIAANYPADAYQRYVSVADRDVDEYMDNIPEFLGEVSAIEVEDDTIAWFHMMTEEDEEVMCEQLSAYSVRLRAYCTLENGAEFALADIEDENGLTRDIPVIIYHNDNGYMFMTPTDWKSKYLPKEPEDIEDCDWRLLDTDINAPIVDGLPRLAPGTAIPNWEVRATRKRIGAELRAAREKAEMSIRELSEVSGIDKMQICRVESGTNNVGIDTIAHLASCLKLAVRLI